MPPSAPPERLATPRLALVRPTVALRDPLDEGVRVSLPELLPVFRWAQVQARLDAPGDSSAHLLERLLAWDDGSAWTWFAFEAARPTRLVGEVCLKTASHEHGALELLFWVRSDATGRGLGTEACDAALEVAFGDLGADLIEARVAPTNPRSRRLLSGLGFTARGTRHDHDRWALFPLDWARSLYRRRLAAAS